MDPRLVTKIANELLPADRQLVVDIGGFMAVPSMHMDISAAGDLVMPWRLGRWGKGYPWRSGQRWAGRTSSPCCSSGTAGS